MSTALPESLRFRLLHIGVAVPELGPAAEMLGSLFGSEVATGPFNDPTQKVSVSFLKQGNSDAAEIELIAPLTQDAPIQSMLKKTGGGAYHLCFETNDLDKALTHLRAQKCLVVSGPAPAVAFGQRPIAWLYTPSRLLIELVQGEGS